MMLWRSLTGRTICQAADAMATRRAAKKTTPEAGASSETAASETGTLLPKDRTRGGTSAA